MMLFLLGLFLGGVALLVLLACYVCEYHRIQANRYECLRPTRLK